MYAGLSATGALTRLCNRARLLPGKLCFERLELAVRAQHVRMFRRILLANFAEASTRFIDTTTQVVRG